MKRDGALCGLGMALFWGGTACSAGSDQGEVREPAQDLQLAQDEGVKGCGKIAEPARLRLEWLDSADAARSVRVSNPGGVDGVVTLIQTVISGDDARSVEFAKMPIGAGRSIVVSVPASEPSSDGTSSLHVTGKAEFADGGRGWDSVKSRLVAEKLVSAESLAARPVMTRALATKRLCFQHPGSFGGDQGEDYFDEGVPTFRPAYGMRVSILNTNLESEHEFVLDRDGCTEPTAFSTGTKIGIFKSIGMLANAIIRVEDMNEGSDVQVTNTTFVIASNTFTQTINFDPTGQVAEQAFNVYQAAAWTLRRVWEGQLSGVLIRLNATTSNSNYFNEVINLEVGDHDNKFTIAHELGHWVMDQLTDAPESSSCGGSHGRASIENQQCALSEGFGNHIAATAFNVVGSSDCRYRGSIDCDQGMTTGGSCNTPSLLWTQVMENCSSPPYGGLGNETDWSRVLWNMRSPGTGLNTTALTDWIRTANDEVAWTKTNVYELLNLRANAIGGTLNTLFDTHKAIHGIDHPVPSSKP